ncbi:hypothetical protein GQ53DRAFT_738052 [Thozetella sp. PMI_491]|nr:hypothetical protein GQ53DRAFT_738052 [Thozetella sp. PMI_491]
MEGAELKACSPCAKAKRKCGKQLPVCSRCQSKGLNCVYAALRTSGFIHYGVESGIHGHLESLSPLSSPYTQMAWFLTPESWSVVPLRTDVFTQASKEMGWRYIHQLRGWLADWTAHGGNSFIHPRLYRARQPLCILDAFTALSSYLTRTPATEDLVQSILEARATALVDSAEAEVLLPDDCYAHLSRVHALFVYSVLRLFDNDIRQRHLAEQQLPTLRAWADAMLSSARRAASRGSFFRCDVIDGISGQGLAPPNQEDVLWHSWILSESIRRTWVAAQLAYGIFTAMQHHEIAECPKGALMYTARRGVWDAPSAFSWTIVCAENNANFIRRDEAQRLFTECRPEAVDEFSKVLMEFDFGKERMDLWAMDVSG